MGVSITYCEATPTQIKLRFSDPVNGTGGTYTIYDPDVQQQPFSAAFQAAESKADVIVLKPSIIPLTAGGTILVSVSGIAEASTGLTLGPLAIGAVVKSALTITNCAATTSLVVVYFSTQLDKSLLNKYFGSDPNFAGNYTVQPAAGQPIHPKSAIYKDDDPKNPATYLELDPNEFEVGQELLVKVENVVDLNGDVIGNSGNNTFITYVSGGGGKGGINGDGKGRKVKEITESVEDAVSYPLLTEQVSFPPMGGATSLTQVGAPAGIGSTLGQTATRAISEVLGWKANGADPKGFIGALTQAFTLTEVEGHIEATWKPRTYAVQTDLGGGITGAQASLYTRAKDALDQVLPLLDGLYPLDPDADPEYVKALREMARSQITSIVSELGTVGGPSVLRVNTYFGILLGTDQPINFGPGASAPEFDPDKIKGTLGQLRDTYGIYFQKNSQTNPFSNSIEDEQDITNFRVISDYLTSLLQSWISNGQFFVLGSPAQPAFFGTQLVLISRQFSVISETVNEVRFALDSVFIGPSERQTLLLQFLKFPAIFLEDMLREIDTFMSQEGPGLLQDGGRISVTNNILPVIKSFEGMVREARRPANFFSLPDGYRTIRVQRAIDDLRDQLSTLINLVQQVTQQVPPPLEQAGALQILSVSPIFVPRNTVGSYSVSIMGAGFVPGATCTFVSGIAGAPKISPSVIQAQFLSPNLLGAQVTVDTRNVNMYVSNFAFTTKVSNPDPNPQAVSLSNGLSVTVF